MFSSTVWRERLFHFSTYPVWNAQPTKCKNKPIVSGKSSSCATYCLQWQMLRGECNKWGLRAIFQKQLWQSVVWRESSEPILFNSHRQIYLPWICLTLFQLVCIWHLYHPVAISSTVIIVFGNGGGECFECFFLTRCWYFASVLPNCSVMWKNKYPLSIYHLHAIHDIGDLLYILLHYLLL